MFKYILGVVFEAGINPPLPTPWNRQSLNWKFISQGLPRETNEEFHLGAGDKGGGIIISFWHSYPPE